jgi:predicted RNA-binding protein with PIN domain
MHLSILIMDGKEIIKRLKEIKPLILNVELKKANQKIDYLIDDIFMYKNNSL